MYSSVYSESASSVPRHRSTHGKGHTPLHDNAIRVLKPREKRYLVTDGRGLWLEVFPGAGLTWVYRYRLNRKPEKVVFGHYPVMSLKVATAERDKLAALVACGRSPAVETSSPSRSPRKILNSLASRSGITVWFSETEKIRGISGDISTMKSCRSLGDQPLRDVTTADDESLGLPQA